MKKIVLKNNERKESYSFPTWLKSYHLLLTVLLVMILFGAIIKLIN